MSLALLPVYLRITESLFNDLVHYEHSKELDNQTMDAFRYIDLLSLSAITAM